MAASWECPGLPMLSLPVKEAGKASFLAIKPMIAAHYEENPDSFHDEIRQLDQLREGAMRPSRDYNGISVLRRYFAQLHLLRARFPPETIGQLPIDFIWKDMFSGVEYVQEGLQMEQASVLYNISAFHSILACRSKRDLEQDIKDSITHFQCAAGAFNYLDEKLAVNHASKDLSPPFVNFFKNLMLGQAQECFVEKSLRGSARVKCVTIAKLAARVADYYTETTRCLETEPCSIIYKKNKDWPKLLRVKMFYFQALSHFYQGGICEELNQHGTMMAWYNLTLKKLGAIGKIPKTLSGENVREVIKNFSDYVQARLVAAKKQNEQVYHDRIPDLETLELISGTDLVKPVMFQPTDSKNLGTDIFGRLVPMRAYEASSVYSEQKAELLRSINSSVTEKDNELEQFMRTLNVGEIEKINEGVPDLPGEVMEQHGNLQGKSMLVKKLHSDLQELMSFSETMMKDLRDTSERKQDDDKEEEEFQAKFGPRPVSQVCASMWKELENFRTYHEQGSKSNADLKAMFDQHYRYMVLLSGPLSSLQAAMPKMTPMDAPEEDARDSDRWRDLQAKVKEMATQRKMLVGQLREQMNNDDITKNLVGHLGTEADTFIEEHMRKHRELADVVRQNLAAQDNILSAVVDANAAKANVRQAVQDLTELQESMFSSLISAGKRFSILQDKIREGLVFYSRLHDNVSKLRKRAFDVTGTRSRERENASRSRTPSSTPSPLPQPPTAVPPLRPPKKAELAGNPLNLSQPPPSDSPHASFSTSKQLLDGNDQELQQHHEIDGEDPINATSPLRDLGMTAPTLNLVTPTATPLSMEEQLRELQRQHQLQLQSLGMAQPSETVMNIGKEQETKSAGPSHHHTSTTVPSQLSNGTHLPTLTTFTSDLPSSTLPMSSQEFGDSLPPALVSSLDASLVSTESSGGGISLPQGLSGGGLLPQGAPLSLTQSTEDERSLKEKQVLLDLQLLLQPPDEVASGLALSLQPEPNTNAQDSLYGVPNANTIPTAASHGLDSSLGSNSLKAQFWNQNQSSMGPANLAGPMKPMDPALPQFSPGLTSTPDFQMQPPASVLASDQDSTSNPTLRYVENQTSTAVFSPTHIPESESTKEGIAGSITTTQSITSGGNNHMESTRTTDSISRPIPAPVLSPPTSPHQTEEFGQNLMESVVEQENGKDASMLAVTGMDKSLHHNGASGSMLNGLKSREASVDTEADFGSPADGNSEQKTDTRDTSANSTPRPILENDSGSLVMNQQSLSSIVSTSTPGMVPISGIDLSQHGIDTDLHSLPQLSDLSFRPIPGIGSMSLHTPLSMSPITLDMGTSHSVVSTQLGNPTEHLQALLASNRTLQQLVDEKTREVEQNRATMADHKSQLENYKQQLLILQQQLSQVSFQQQKQEQDKATASGQQAVLMQLLQQQQGMFSQQQAQIEKLSKATDSHRREQMETEVKYKQALAVEQEKSAGLTSQNFQQNQEIQRLQQQLQSSTQQQQMVQVHLYQYQSQIQERDKQLLAFRDQHKQIIQSLEQRYQQKVTQMVQQIQELQGELKKAKSHKQSRSPHPSNSSAQQPTGVKKSPSPAQVPAQQFSQMMLPVSMQQPAQPHPQQFVQSLRTPSQGTPISPHSTGMQRRQGDILTPTSAASTQSIQQRQQQQHQIMPLQPQSVHVPPVSMGGTTPQLASNQPQLPTPLTPQPVSGGMSHQGISMGVSQAYQGISNHPVSQQQAPRDGLNRSMSWNANQQQQPTPLTQGNQQQLGPRQPQSMQQQQQQQQHLASQQSHMIPSHPVGTQQQQLAQGQQQHQERQQQQQQQQPQPHGGQGFPPVSSQQFMSQPQLSGSQSVPTANPSGMAVLTPQQVQGTRQQPSSSYQPNVQPVQHPNPSGQFLDGQGQPNFSQQQQQHLQPQLQPQQGMSLGHQLPHQQAYQQVPPHQGYQQQLRH